MHNHSDIWKNITMIIFFILLFIFMILIFKFRVLLHIEIHGLKTLVRVKFLWIKLEKSAGIKLKSKNNLTPKVNKKKKIKFSKTKIIKLLKTIYFENLSIKGNVGALTPLATVLVIPAISVALVLPLNFLTIDSNKFLFDINPIYNDLKFDFQIDANISFRIGKILINAIA